MTTEIEGILLDGRDVDLPNLREYLAARERTARNFVLAEWGQSNMVGRAPGAIYGDAASHTPARTYIWVQSGGPRGWELLDPTDYTQNNDGTSGLHGIEIYLSYIFENEFPGDKLYIMKHAVGGAGLASGAGSDYHPVIVDNELYSFLVEAFDAAIAELPASWTPFGILSIQGETDAYYNATDAFAYYDNLIAFYNQLISDVPDLATFGRYIARISTYAASYAEHVRINQVKYCIGDYPTVLIDTDHATRQVAPENAHYDAAGFWDIAQRVMFARFGIGGAHLTSPVPPRHYLSNYGVEVRGLSAPATVALTGVADISIDGHDVTLNIRVVSGSTAGASGALEVTGLPLKATKRVVGYALASGITAASGTLIALWDAGASSISFFTSDANTQATVSIPASSTITLFVTLPGLI